MHALTRTGSRVALRVAPLALLAVSAQAAAIFNIAGTSCDGQIGQPIAAVATNNLVANPLPPIGGVQGAVLNGSCFDTVGESGLVLEASMFGDFTGSDMPLPTTLPMEFDFTVGIPDPGFIEVFDWYVELFINDVSYYSTGNNFVSANPANINGGGNTDTLPGGTLGPGDTWRAVVGVDCWLCEGDLTIDLGNSSLRINPAQDQPAVPEPSTISLFAAGAALLWFKRRRQA